MELLRKLGGWCTMPKKNIGVRLEDSEIEQIRKEATRQNRTMSDFIRLTVLEKLKNLEEKEKASE